MILKTITLNLRRVIMKVMGSTLEQGELLKQQQSKDMRFSKVLVAGKKYKIFFTYDQIGDAFQIRAAVNPGRNLDYEKLKFGFYPVTLYTTTEQNQILDQSGLDFYYTFSRIFHEACYRNACAEAEQKAANEAKNLGEPIDKIALAQTLKDIEIDYKGNNESNPKKMPKYNLLVGNISIKTFAQCLIIPITDKGCDFNEAKIAQVELSQKKGAQLKAILRDPLYRRHNDGFLEVIYDYAGADKQEAGMNAAFQGTSNDTSIEVLFPEQWKIIKNEWFPRMAATAELIADRNRDFSTNVTAQQIAQAVKKYISDKRGILVQMDWESDLVKRNAEDMLKYEMDAGTAIVRKSLMNAAELWKKEHAGEEEAVYEKREISEQEISEAINDGNNLTDLVNKYREDEDGYTSAEFEDISGLSEEFGDIEGGGLNGLDGLGEPDGLDELAGLEEPAETSEPSKKSKKNAKLADELAGL